LLEARISPAFADAARVSLSAAPTTPGELDTRGLEAEDLRPASMPDRVHAVESEAK
jgi:hypothetical protein